MTTVQGKALSTSTRYRFHACLGYVEDEKQHLYSMHAMMEEVLINSLSLMGIRYNESGEYILFKMDDGEVLEPDKDYLMDYAAIISKE